MYRSILSVRLPITFIIWHAQTLPNVVLHNGHKKKHTMKFQGVVTPDGRLTDMWGPVLGKRHDNYLLAQFEPMHKLDAHFNSPPGPPYCLYGDQAYGLSDHHICPLSTVTHGPLTPEMVDINNTI